MAGNTGSPLCAELNRIANYGVYPDRDDFLEEQGAANVWADTSGLGLLGALNYIVDPNRTDNNYKGLTAVCNELAGTTGLSDVDALRTIGHPAEVLLKGTTARSASYYVDAATPRYNYPGYLTMSGVDGDYISTPDAAALDITGAIDLQIKVMLPVVPPAKATTNLIQKGTASNLSYTLFMDNSGYLGVLMSSSGTAWDVSAYSTAVVSFPANTVKWVRATFTPNNGSGSRETKFFTSDDGTTWTQLGTTVTAASISGIFSGNAQVGIAGSSTGTTSLLGRFYRAIIKNGIDGTTVLDVNAETNITSATYNQFTATTGQLVTINGQDVLTNGGTAGSLLPTTVGSSLAADSNDPKFLAHTGTNYVYLPGVIANYLSVPDATTLQITGDVEFRAYVAADDWTPAASLSLVGRWNGGLSTRSYRLYIDTAGKIVFARSIDGINTITFISSVAPTIADGSPLWVRAQFTQNNGSSQSQVLFGTSTDGTTWTQLGTTQTDASTAATYIGTTGNAVLELGAITNGAQQVLAGKIYRAQILNGIDGTTVLDVDTSVIATGAATSFTAVTGQTVTINRSTSGRKSVAVTQPTWLFGTDDYMEVNNRYMAHSTAAENYVYLSGASGNYMSVADNPPLDVTGDIDLRARVALDDWTPASSNVLIGKRTSGQYAYQFIVQATGALSLGWTTDGVTGITVNSTVAPTITDGAVKWVRATLDVNNGAGAYEVKFFTSDDGTTWTQLGTTVTGGTTTSLYSGTAPVELGTVLAGTGGLFKGKFYRAQILNGIDGTVVLDADASVITLPSQTTFVDRSSNAYTVTINKSGVGTFVSTGNYLYLPGIASNYASAPDSAALDITGDLDLRVKVALDDWTSINQLLSKWVSGSNQRSYRFWVAADGKLNFSNSTDGLAGTVRTSTSSVAPTVTDGATLWVRVTCDVDNGASGNDVKFFTSDDGLTWTQLGTTITTAGVTSIFAGTGIAEIGTQDGGGNNPARGKFYRAQVLNGIGGTVAFDANFENSITSLLQTTFTESSTNGATVTINRSGSTFRSAGVIDAGYLYPGATNTFSNSTTDFLNFGATDSLTAIAVLREFATPTSNQNILAKYDASRYWYLRNQGTAANLQTFLFDGTNTPGTAGPSFTLGGLITNAMVVNRTTQTVSVITNGVSGSTASISSLGSVSNVGTFRISNLGGGGYADMEFIGAAVFRTVLTAKNISDINNYFQNRD